MENDVAATARITAAIRARETARPDGLFRDPLAEMLAGPAAMAAMQAMPEAVRDRSSMYTVIRTRVFDDWLATTVGPGSRVAQVVLLGAGFDSRAFRLDWPPGMRLWELDQGSLLAAKEAILGHTAAQPRCQRATVAVDFADADWPAEIKSAGLRPEAPTAWLAEGLLPYLTPEVAVDPRQLLADHGWTTTSIMRPGDQGANFGRFTTFPGMPGLPLPLLSFVLARRA